jgi:signal transduction histidine kinase/HAMP domain-containing protein
MSMQVEKHRTSYSLVSTLTFAFLALSLTVLVIAIATEMIFNFQTQQEIIASEQQLIAQGAADTVASFVEGKFALLETAAKLSDLTSVSQQEQENILGNLLGLELAFRQLVLLDSQEQMLTQASRLSQALLQDPLDQVGSGLFAQVRQGNRYISSVYVNDVTSEPMIVIAVPATNTFGDFQGTLVAEVNLKFMWDLVDRLEIGETGVAYVVDKEGNLIAFGDVARVLRGENVRDLNEVGEFTRSPASVDETGTGISTGINGKTVVGTYVPLGTPDWAVVTELPIAEAYQDVTRSVVISAGIMIAAAALAGFIGVTAARRLAVPLINLTETASRIAAGETELQAKIEGPSEVATLARTFNDMTIRLRDLIAGLENRTRELEASQRVTFAASERVTPDELLDLVVNLIRDQFDLYHAQVYIIDEEQNAAVLRQSTGYAGRQLLQRGHKIPLDATALVTKAIHDGKPVLVNDTANDPSFMANPLLPETKSELVVPLKLKAKIIGVLDTQDRTPGRFGSPTVNLFQSMADQIATLFENSELIERVTEQAESLTIFTSQLRTAAEIARRMGTILDPEQLLEQTVEMLQSRFGLYHAHIYMLDEANRKLIMRSGSGEVGRVLCKQGYAISLDAENSLIARAARNEQSVLVNDASLESDFMFNPLLPQTRSELAIPLISGDKALGVLDIQDDQLNRFSETDIDTLRTLAGQIATTLQTAGIFEETQVRLKVSQALANAQTENDVLDVLIQQAGMYPQTQVMVFMNEWDKEDRFLYLRRAESFESRLTSSPPPGLRLPASQVQMISAHSRTDGIFVSPNLPEDENADPTVREMARQTGAKSMLTLPIVERDELVGIVSISSEEEEYFDEQKIRLYRAMSEQGATALRIARLNDENVRTAERLREVDRLKSEFLASMSHELRTPLNSIIGYTEIMLMGLDSELDPETLEDVQAIYDNGQHLLRIINDVLDLAKIEAGRLELNEEEVSVEALVDAASSSVTGLLVNKDKPVEFKVEVEGDLPTIQGDQVRLNQVINNLTSNAVKFTDEGHITLRAFKDDGWICIEVEDTGIGIAEEDLNNIFERFQQVDGSNARKQEGTGLGLAITRHLVQMHGGTIEVKSEVGEGSTFTVRLPAEHRETESTAG